jgi:replicative DNA helicase
VATEELAVINSVLKDPANSVSILFGQSVDDLFVAYRDVWDDMKSYYSKHHAIPDFQIMQDKHGFEDVYVKGSGVYYLDNLKNHHISSRINSILSTADNKLNMENLSGPEVLGALQVQLSKLNKFSHSANDLNIMDFDAAEQYYDEVRERALENGGVPGIPTGVGFIDSAYTSGLRGGDLVVVLGWTGRAKSLFTTLICCNAHDKGYKPMIVSLEMPGEKIRDRVYTIKGSGLFTNSGLSLGDIEIDNFNTFRNKNEGRPDFLVVTNGGYDELTPNVIQAKIDQHKPDVLVFDYAQLASDNENSTDMTARMRNMSKQFKRLAVSNDIPVLLISSATADSSSSTNDPPTIEQVAWSKQLAFDADLAFAVHKHDDDGPDGSIIEIVCRKNRNGPLFSGFLEWNIDRGTFKELFDL